MKIDHFSGRFAAIALAAVVVFSGCHKKVVPPPPPPPPPAAPAPTASITANPVAIDRGQSSTLTWTTANASKVTISGIGTVATSGTQSVSPMRSTDYTLMATGSDGTSVQATARVTVNQPAVAPPPAAAAGPSLTEEQLFAQSVKDVYFDYDKYALRSGDESVADQDAAFLKSHPGMKVLIAGHCDDRGSEEYNLALGENRAESLKKALVADGVDASRIRVVSDGEEKPFCTEETESCWQENRRDHLTLDR